MTQLQAYQSLQSQSTTTQERIIITTHGNLEKRAITFLWSILRFPRFNHWLYWKGPLFQLFQVLCLTRSACHLGPCQILSRQKCHWLSKKSHQEVICCHALLQKNIHTLNIHVLAGFAVLDFVVYFHLLDSFLLEMSLPINKQKNGPSVPRIPRNGNQTRS